MGFRVLSASSPNYRSDGSSSGRYFSVDLRIFLTHRGFNSDLNRVNLSIDGSRCRFLRGFTGSLKPVPKLGMPAKLLLHPGQKPGRNNKFFDNCPIPALLKVARHDLTKLSIAVGWAFCQQQLLDHSAIVFVNLIDEHTGVMGTIYLKRDYPLWDLWSRPLFRGCHEQTG